MVKASLTEAASIVIRILWEGDRAYYDPYVLACGSECYSAIEDSIERNLTDSLAAVGWTVTEFDKELRARTSDRWAAFSPHFTMLATYLPEADGEEGVAVDEGTILT